MFEKTTSPKFKQFGLCLSQDIDPINMNFYEFSNKSVTNLNITTKDDTYIKTINGLTMILVATDPNNIYSFILNRPIKLKKGIYFNFISISNKSLISISNTINSYSFLSLSQSYIYSSISSSLNITEIYTKFYQEKGINYRFNGESHPYWELTYVDKGCLYTNVNNSTYVLNQGDLMFYSPFQFHTQYTLDNESCSYLTINFNMEFDKFKLLCDKVFTLDRTSYSTINFLIKELSLSDIYSDDLSLCYLKQLIINILRTKNLSSYSKPTTHMQQSYENNLLNEILSFINNNIYNKICIETICSNFSISPTTLHSLFKKNMDITVKNYVNNLKLNKGKELIKNSSYTFSEISEILGFSSIHYFSKKFKSHFGISPTECSKSIYK